MSDLNTRLGEISNFVATLDLAKPDEAEAALNETYPQDGDAMQGLVSAARAALSEGTICDRENGDIRFSRVTKPAADPAGCSVDAVLMEDCSGPAHTHTKGEVCVCIAEEGSPTFEGRDDFWIVMPEGSRHVPTVKGGRMLILYWWPEGAVEW